MVTNMDALFQPKSQVILTRGGRLLCRSPSLLMARV